MKREFYQELALKSMQGELLSDELCMQVLTAAAGTELLPLLDAAYQVRKKYFGNEVQLHMINNAQNGYCPEDCHYCSQAKSSNADIENLNRNSQPNYVLQELVLLHMHLQIEKIY